MSAPKCGICGNTADPENMAIRLFDGRLEYFCDKDYTMMQKVHKLMGRRDLKSVQAQAVKLGKQFGLRK